MLSKLILLFLASITVLFCTKPSENDPIQEESVIFRAPSEYASYFIKNDSLNFQSVNHSLFRLYFEEDTYSATDLETIRYELDIATDRVFEVLDVDDYNYGTHILLVDSEEDMEALMGYHIKGGAAKGHDLLFITNSDSVRPQFKHEFFHLASYEIWGLTEYRLLDEGAATYTDNECYYENPFEVINAFFYKKNMLFELRELVEEFDESAAENDVIAYLQSAGYFKYLYETYGVEKMKKLWNDGFDSFESIYGITIEELDNQFRTNLTSISIPDDFDEDLILQTGCG